MPHAVFALLVLAVSAPRSGPGRPWSVPGPPPPALQATAVTERLAPCLSKLKLTRQGRRLRAETWRHVDDLAIDRDVLAQLSDQPEFRLRVWDYLAVMTDQERVDDGRAAMASHRAAVDAASRRHAVEGELLAAIWGIETNFGRGKGRFGVLRSLATLSCRGRRQAYFRNELFAALRIVQAGHVAPERFMGSWAGAFGHTQFMPGTFEGRAVDLDGDGRRDVIDNVGDALASTANYLRHAGWRQGMPWGFEVRTPAGIATAHEGRRVVRPLATWAARGVTRVDGAPLLARAGDSLLAAGLFLPAGPVGPAFLVTRNFEAIYRYNASESYALAIAHLADRLGGGTPFATAWPTDDPGLSRDDRREMQRLLRTRGHRIDTVDAILSPQVRAAIKVEQQRLGHEATGRPGQRLLSALRRP